MSSKSRTIMILILILALMMPLAASAKQAFRGQIVGLTFAHHSHKYPRDMMIIHAQFEPDFVLLAEKGKHYMLPNLPRDVKVRYLGETLTIKGELGSKGTSITVDRLEVKKGAASKVVWSMEMHKKAIYELYSPE